MSVQTASPLNRWRVALASAFILLFLLPNLWALVVPYEAFPYSSAPMFAHYMSQDMPRYRFRFIAEYRGGERELSATDLGLNGVEFTRYFFGHVYGSTDPLTPLGRHGEDTPADFTARLSTFFQDALTVFERQGVETAPFTRVRLDLVELNADNREVRVRPVGSYDPLLGRFVPTSEASR